MSMADLSMEHFMQQFHNSHHFESESEPKPEWYEIAVKEETTAETLVRDLARDIIKKANA